MTEAMKNSNQLLEEEMKKLEEKVNRLAEKPLPDDFRM
jgi:hypothetical protein